MQIFVFGSNADANVAAFTEDRDGGNLPSDFAPWQALGGSLIQAGGGFGGVSESADAVFEAIARDGYFLARSEDQLADRPAPHRRRARRGVSA